MNGKTLLPDPSLIRLERFVSSPDAITVIVKTKQPQAFCTLCQQASQKIHSRYVRRIADLPWQGVAIHLRLTVRRFFCINENCQRKIFAEPLPSVVKRYARKTTRLSDALTLIAFAIGGEAGARVAKRLSMISSPDTLLRRIRQAALVQRPTPKVLGVDDWAFRKRQRYGTIIIDLEKRCPIDLLQDREAETLKAWLMAHPGVEIISRDRATAYAEAARQGAPQAIPIADRWHLLKNLNEALDRLLSRHNQRLTEASEIVIRHQLSHSPTMIESGATTMLSSRPEPESGSNRKKRLARYRQLIQLHQQGLSMPAIAKALGMGRETVRKFIGSEGFPERAKTARRASRLDPFLPILHQRWAEGCRNARQLWRDIKGQGYPCKEAMVRRYRRRLKSRLSEDSLKEQIKVIGLQETFKRPSTKRATWWIVKRGDDLKAEERLFVEQLCRISPDIQAAKELADCFQKMIKEGELEKLDDWLERAEQSGVKEMQGFAQGLRKDREAVVGALQYEWRNGPVEGQVNRLKTIKRQMYGRANFDLLKARVLYRSS